MTTPIKNLRVHPSGSWDRESESSIAAPNSIDESLAVKLLRFAAMLAIAAMAIGFADLVGWLFRVSWLKSFPTETFSFKPNSALNFMLSGLSLLLLRKQQAVAAGPRSTRWLAGKFLAGVVLLMAALTLLEFLSGRNFGIDEILFKGTGEPNNPYPGRMGILAAFNFVLIGGSLLLLDVPGSRPSLKPAPLLALAAGLASLVVVLGFIFDVRNLYSIGFFTYLSLYAGIAFLFLCLGILWSRPVDGFIAEFNGKGIGSVVSRRLVPIVFVTPIIIGWLRLQGQDLGLYDTEFGLAIMIISTFILTGVIVWWQAGLLNRQWREQKDTFDRLQESEKRFSLMAENLEDYAVFFLDQEGNVSIWNEGSRRLTGYVAGEIIGRNYCCFFTPEDDAQNIPAGLLRTALEKGFVKHEGWRVRKDGSRFWADAVTTALVDEKGILRGYAKIVRNITERKQAEERKAYSMALERSNRELQDFAFVASHDLQEPLRKILSFGGFLSRHMGDSLDEKGRHFLERMQDAANRMENLIRDLLTLTRVTTKALPFAPVNLSGVLQEVLQDLEVRLEETSGLVEADPLPEIEADPVQMRQLFQNLLGNALKFHRPGVPPLVKVQCEMMEAAPPEKGIFCRITVKDNGIGFDQKYSDKIFKPFERLHAQHEFPGSGIGLAVCLKIMERHGGTITAQGAPGEGAAFTVSLPLRQS